MPFLIKAFLQCSPRMGFSHHHIHLYTFLFTGRGGLCRLFFFFLKKISQIAGLWPCYALALLSPCVSGLKLPLWWNAHEEFSLYSQSWGELWGRQKQLVKLMPSLDPHLHLLLNKSVAMTTSREPRKAGRQPDELFSSVALHWDDSHPVSDWATGENTNLSWSQSFLNTIALAQGQPWLLYTWLQPKLVLPISFCSLLDSWLWLPLTLHGSQNPC